MSLSSSLTKGPCDQTPDEICPDCSKYDFQGALAALSSSKYPDRNEYPSDGIIIAKVGKRYRTPFETNCSLCRILLASLKSALDLYPIIGRGKCDVDELRALLASQSSALSSYFANNRNLIKTYPKQALLALEESNDDPLAMNNQNKTTPDNIKRHVHKLLASRKLSIEMYLLIFQGKNDTAELCALLESQKSALESYLIDRTEGDTDELRAFILLKDTTIHDVSVRASFFAWRNRSIYIDLVPSKFPLNSELRRAHGTKQGFAVIRQPHELPKFTAQVVPPYFDPAVAKGWICHCRQHHHKTCFSQQDAAVAKLNLIDCESLTVDQGHPQAPFVALSYVWGSSTACGQYSLESITGGTSSLPSVLPPVILDAIAVTKLLGFRYLWVDKFCIDQVNNEVKHEQITQMDSVYENAEITIIAAAGVDETHGLPGVGSKARSSQPIARIGGLTVLSTMRDSQQSIRSSKWFTRGWTFQEALLTRRRLVFTEEQVYFECGAMNCCESFSGSTDALYSEWGSTSPQYLRAGMFERSGWHKFVGFRSKPGNALNIFTRYLTAVEDYTARELRFEHDSLNAFAGIMKKFERAREPIIQLWGIPTTIRRGELTERCFVEALCWSHAHTGWDDGFLRPSRRPDFPSWSWAGWAGKVEYAKMFSFKSGASQLSIVQLSEWQQSILTATVHVKISLESEAGQMLKLSEIEMSTRVDVAFAKVLHLHGAVLPSSSFSYDEKTGWTLSRLSASIYLSRGPESQSRLLEQLNDERSSLQCIIVADTNFTIFGLILETRGSVSSRVGLVTARCAGVGRKLDYERFERRTFHIV
ncbi:hypothetical protein MKX08_000548 [Trichoderma sp. CBMAI-0020]|nr:hypothetical protein MKX08_000548 [Trichoderma sp. CBMAI-0020]